MTTIAFKDGVMAAESCQTHEYIDQVECRKLYVIEGDIIGLAGTLTDFPKFLHWYLNEREDFTDVEGPSKAIDEIHALVYSEGKLYFYDEQCVAIPMNGECAAIGSGSSYAMGALMAGATAQEAVGIAARLDPSSNPPIYYLEVDKVEAGEKDPIRYEPKATARTKKK